MSNILICDDSSLTRIQLRKILQDEGYNVFESINFEQIKLNTFSKKIGLCDIDLILLDVYLKNSTGFQVLKYLKNEDILIPVIMISVDNKKKVITKALDFGVADYILKPFDFSDFNVIFKHL